MFFESTRYRITRNVEGYCLQQRWYYFGIPVTKWTSLFEDYIQKNGEIEKLIKLCCHSTSRGVHIAA